MLRIWVFWVVMVAIEFAVVVKFVSIVPMRVFTVFICVSCWLKRSFIKASSVRVRFEFIALLICTQDIESVLSVWVKCIRVSIEWVLRYRFDNSVILEDCVPAGVNLRFAPDNCLGELCSCGVKLCCARGENVLCYCV